MLNDLLFTDSVAVSLGIIGCILTYSFEWLIVAVQVYVPALAVVTGLRVIDWLLVVRGPLHSYDTLRPLVALVEKFNVCVSPAVTLAVPVAVALTITKR